MAKSNTIILSTEMSKKSNPGPSYGGLNNTDQIELTDSHVCHYHISRYGAQPRPSGHSSQEDQPHGRVAGHEHQGEILAAGPGAGEGEQGT